MSDQVRATIFQSTLPVGGATPKVKQKISPQLFQSTLPVGGATWILLAWVASVPVISIHAPRGGSDAVSRNVAVKQGNFNPRSPWGERHMPTLYVSHGVMISIHAPRGGSDDAQARYNRLVDISIHAPRGGSDS